MRMPTDFEPLKAPGLVTDNIKLDTGNSFKTIFAICSASLSTNLYLDFLT